MSLGRKIGTFQNKLSNTIRLLSVYCDSKLTFEYHIPEISKKASTNIFILAKVVPFLSLLKKLILINSIFMFAIQLLPSFMDVSLDALINWKINWLHERCLQLISIYRQSTFKELLERKSSVSIQYSNFNDQDV